MNFKQTGRRTIYSVATWKRVLGIACLFFLIAAVIGVCMVGREETKRKENSILITAHRGASYGAPENTRASVALALEEQADCVEIDVRMTADGIPVLLHDRALFRTTGIVKEIDQVTYREVSLYNAGVRHGERFAKETVPALEDILREFGEKIRFNIELKEQRDGELVLAVVKLIEAYGLEEQCAVTSDAYEQLELIKELNGEIETGYILSRVYGEIYGYEAADFFSVKAEYITEQTVKGVHRKGKEIHAWTVNKSYEMERMKELGVDSIITDRPAYAKEILEAGNIY